MAPRGGVARGRLAEERKNHPHPETLPDGFINLMVWNCFVPGKEGGRLGWRLEEESPAAASPAPPRPTSALIATTGFVAKPETLPDGSVNLMVWDCVIPGKQGTDWEGGYFPLTLHFTEDYPSSPPTCKFPPGFFHVNVYNTGVVCLSILGRAWNPSITVRQILIGIQDLLDNPNPASSAQSLCYQLLTKNLPEYKYRVRQQAKRYPSLV